MPYVHVNDLDPLAFRDFRRKALSSLRLSKEDVEISDIALIDSLWLADGNYLKRAAILLFHEDPEKWVVGSYVKIEKPSPVFTATSTEVRVTFPFGTTFAHARVSMTNESEQEGKSNRDADWAILAAADTPQSRAELLAAAELTDVYWNYQRHVLQLVEQGLLALTIPDKPKSRLQRYVITDAGREVLVARRYVRDE